MPELKPFRGIRYGATSELEDLVCPPYDVITSEEQARLHARHPNNAVRVELPFWLRPDEHEQERYRRAGRQFRDWITTGVLTRDDAPAFYVYRQDFTHEARRRRVVGVIGALKLEPFGADAGVLPHERTTSAPIEDRLALMRACPVNISPIYGIYRGAGGLSEFYGSLRDRSADAGFVDDLGTKHSLWSIRSPSEMETIASALSRGPLVIADGHHRYETALAYHAERAGTPGEHDAVMCFCVDADAEDLVVLPYHRALTTSVDADELEQRLTGRFTAKRLSAEESSAALHESSADHRFVFVLPDGDLLVEVPDEYVDDALAERPRAWRELDVVALHEAVLPAIAPEGVVDLSFSKDAADIEMLVRQQRWTAGVLLKPLDATEVVEVARAGERMPQKASYFWPKAVTGMVFRSLGD